MLPVLVLTGFLGAGKTTLLQRILQFQDRFRLGVVVNDFATLNIDARLISAQYRGMIALQNGCVCCTLRDGLVQALQRLRAAQASQGLDCIVVEASGLSNGANIAATLSDPAIADQFVLAGLICVMDAANFAALDYQETEFVIDQAAASDLVVLNKIDLIASRQDIACAYTTISGAAPHALMVETIDAHIDDALVRALLRGEFARTSQAQATGIFKLARESLPVDAAARYETFSWTLRQPLDSVEIKQRLDQIPQNLARAKGVFYPSDMPGVCMVYNLAGAHATLIYVDRDPALPARARHGLAAIFKQGEPGRQKLETLFPSRLFAARLDRADA